MSTQGLDFIFNLHPIPPGSNVHGVNTYAENTTVPNMTNDPDGCQLYEWYVNTVVVPLYPNPTGVLKRNLNLKYVLSMRRVVYAERKPCEAMRKTWEQERVPVTL